MTLKRLKVLVFFHPIFDGEKNILQDDLWMRHVRASKMMIYKARQGAPRLQQKQKKALVLALGFFGLFFLGGGWVEFFFLVFGVERVQKFDAEMGRCL